MACKITILMAFIAIQPSCSWINIFKGPDDYYRHYYADSLKQSIDSSIKHEANNGAAPGFTNREYSEANWNKSWNDRIFSMYGLEKRPYMKAYDGPTGDEFILYIIQERRSRGLPELVIEERNKDRVP